MIEVTVGSESPYERDVSRPILDIWAFDDTEDIGTRDIRGARTGSRVKALACTVTLIQRS